MAIPEPTLLTTHVQPNHKVLYVGGFSFPKDPAPLFLSHHLDESQGGMLVLLDAQGHPGTKELKKDRIRLLPKEFLLETYTASVAIAARQHARGAGRPDVYANVIEALAKREGLEHLVRPHLHFANALHTHIRPESMGAVVDRGSSPFIIAGNSHLERQHAIAHLANEYARVLVPEGKAILLFEEHSNLSEALEAEFRKMGFGTETLHVIPATQVPYSVGPLHLEGKRTYRAALVATKLSGGIRGHVKRLGNAIRRILTE
ncbi:hypothetical protein HYV43_07080 [Candidatus Micrarchaeota archaeon]|nr:hypothetical protein [Candidatus Micrarchaeota archaeon]